MSTATTPGTAKGKKMSSRIALLPRARPESSASAKNSASPSMMGTCIRRISAVRPSPKRKAGSWNART